MVTNLVKLYFSFLKLLTIRLDCIWNDQMQFESQSYSLRNLKCLKNMCQTKHFFNLNS